MNTGTDNTDIHTYMGLSYANYLVLNRTLLQSMPAQWQHTFVGLLQELDGAFEHVTQAPAFQVTAGREAYLNELTHGELRTLGYTITEDCYYNADGDEVSGADAAVHRVFVPISDPVPYYDHGRTHIAPQQGDRR